MALSSHRECSHCNAVYKLSHDMDNDYYKVVCCPFCGESVEEEESFDQENDQNE